MQAALKKGMDSLSQAEVGSTLQVFYNLQELPTVRVAVPINTKHHNRDEAS